MAQARVCQLCGSFVRDAGRLCTNCGAYVSPNATTVLVDLPPLHTPSSGSDPLTGTGQNLAAKVFPTEEQTTTQNIQSISEPAFVNEDWFTPLPSVQKSAGSMAVNATTQSGGTTAMEAAAPRGFAHPAPSAEDKSSAIAQMALSAFSEHLPRIAGNNQLSRLIAAETTFERAEDAAQDFNPSYQSFYPTAMQTAATDPIIVPPAIALPLPAFEPDLQSEADGSTMHDHADSRRMEAPVLMEDLFDQSILKRSPLTRSLPNVGPKVDDDSGTLTEKTRSSWWTPKTIALAAVSAVLIFIISGSLFCCLPFGKPTAQPPNLQGAWRIMARFNNRVFTGLVDINQNGSQISGAGSDEAGAFSLSGEATPEGIQLYKTYLSPGANGGSSSKGTQIIIRAEVASADGGTPQSLSGMWSPTGTGYLLQSHAQSLCGKWAAMRATAQSNSSITLNTESKTDVPAWRAVNNIPLSQKLLFVAVFLIVLIAGLGFGSLALFGPNGMMNIWEKDKYIPSQFRSPHKKLLKELAKPWTAGALPLGRRIEWAPWKFWEFGAKDLCLPASVRDKDPHMLILGASDKGKSRLVADMICHDIEARDRAVVVIDSDGELVDLVSKWIATNPKGNLYAKHTLFLDPTYTDGELRYNPLKMPEDRDLQSAASSVVYGFKAIYTEPPGSQNPWNQQTANILRNCALLLMINNRTLADLPTLLNENDFRDVLLEAVQNRRHERPEYTTLLDTWTTYRRLARTEQWITWVEPILNRITPVLSDARIRNIIASPDHNIDLIKVIEEKQILLVKVPRGQLDENANLLGSLLVTGLKQAALSLSNKRSKNQEPVSMYLDGFDNCIDKDTIQTITTETDKFKIGFIGIIRTLQHLPEDFRNQIIINVGTCACFSLAKKDGDLLGPQMFRVDGRKIKHQTIQNFFNKVNTSPQFELISDEEKLNIDRVVGQEARNFFCYRVGSVAGVFHMRSHEFKDIPDSRVDQKAIDDMRRPMKKRA